MDETPITDLPNVHEEPQITPVWEVVEDMARRLGPTVALDPAGPVAKAVFHLLEAAKILKGD